MRLVSAALIVLLASQAMAAEYELLFFTQNPDVCPPCIPVKKMVTTLVNQGRAITVYNFQLDDRPFQHYGIDSTPSFLLLKDGKKYRYYEQSDGHSFTPQFLMDIAPPAERKSIPSVRANCVNPIAKVLKNILPVPPPPGTEAPDVPDRQKVARIIVLEQHVAELKAQLILLVAEAEKIKTGPAGRSGANGKAGPSGRDGSDGQDGADGVDGQPGRDGANGRDGADGVDDRPITVRIDIINDAGDVIDTKTQTYPRGTPVVLRFSEKLLKQ